MIADPTYPTAFIGYYFVAANNQSLGLRKTIRKVKGIGDWVPPWVVTQMRELSKASKDYNLLVSMQEGKQLLSEINEARAKPQDCIEDIKQELARFESGNVMRTRKGEKLRVIEGKATWQDAILYLERAKPKPALVWSSELGETAQAYLSIRSTSDPNPFKLLKSRYDYEANISFNVNESQVSQSLRELVIAMIVGDGDEKKGNRTTLFHPTYTHFGAVVAKDKQGSYVPMYFCETGKFEKKEGGPIGGGLTGGEKSETLGNKIVYTDRGKELIAELNRIRKDPKSIISSLKADLGKFKEDKSLVKDNVIMQTKEGKEAYQDLITELEEQYPIPLLKVSEGLCTASADQAADIEQCQQGQPGLNYLTLLKKYCAANDGVANLTMNRSEEDTYTNMLILLLVGDGDKKRSARRKLLSPVLKVVGAAVGESFFVINIGENARDNKEAIDKEQAAWKSSAASKQQSKEEKKEAKKELPKECLKELPKPQLAATKGNEEQERVIKKKTTKSKKVSRGGKQYKVTVTTIHYADGDIEEEEEQELIG